MLERYRAGLIAGVLAALVAVSSCGTSSDSEPRKSATPSTLPARAPDIDPQKSSKIPLQGSESVPIHWSVPDISDLELQDATLAARRYQALDYYVVSKDDYTDLAPLYGTVTSGERLRTQYHATRNGRQGSQMTGPVWLRVLPPEQAGPMVKVTICADESHHHEVTETDHSKNDRGVVSHTYWVRRNTDSGDTVWKVDAGRFASGKAKQTCDDWEPDGHRSR